jgi:hypothetical protein
MICSYVSQLVVWLGSGFEDGEVFVAYRTHSHEEPAIPLIHFLAALLASPLRRWVWRPATQQAHSDRPFIGKCDCATPMCRPPDRALPNQRHGRAPGSGTRTSGMSLTSCLLDDHRPSALRLDREDVFETSI